MKTLNKTKCYLVGAIQYTSNGRTWREKAEIFLQSINVTVFNPFKKPFVEDIKEDETTKQWMIDNLNLGNFHIVESHMKKIRALDLRCVDLSDFIIGYIDPKVMSWGTADEIFTALRLRKPVFLVIDGGAKNTPVWLLGSMSHDLIYPDFDSLFSYLKEIDDGNIQLDSKYWKLLKPEFR